MDDTINNTQSAPGTANPQTAVPADGASNGADFQSTAPSDALRNEVDNLSVQETGEPATGSVKPTTSSDISLGWVITVGVMAVIAIVVLFRLIKEAIEDDKSAPRSAAPAAAASTSVKKKPAKKPAAKKKTAPNQRKKKPAAKKKR